MLVPASLLQSVECSAECKNSIFHCTIGCNKYKSSLASGASPQTPPGGLFLPPGPPPPAWVHAAHRHGMVSPRKVWFQRPCSSLVLVPEEVVEPASGRYCKRPKQTGGSICPSFFNQQFIRRYVARQYIAGLYRHPGKHLPVASRPRLWPVIRERFKGIIQCCARAT